MQKQHTGSVNTFMAFVLLCLFVIVSTFGIEVAVAEEPPPPSISEMLIKVARAEAQPEVVERVDAAAQKLEEDDLYGAKMEIMHLKASVELTAADYRVLDPIERRVDKALGEDLEQVTLKIEEELEQKGRLSEYRRQKKVEEELKRRSAEVLVDKARTELYRRNKPAEAVELAREAYALDPTNREAERLIIAAEAELQERAAVLTEEADLLSEHARIRVQSLKQEYAAIKRRAMRLQKEGEYEQARDTWRNARTYVNVLDVYTDMQEEAELVERQLQYTEEEARRIEEQRRVELERRREEEARRRLEEEMRAKEELEAEREAEMLNDAWSYVRRGRYREARKIVDEMLLLDSTNEGALVMLDIITRREHDDLMKTEVQRREREDLALIRKAMERATARADEITYPDRELWERIMQRDEVHYPTEVVDVPPEELAIREELKQEVGLDFERHRDLPEITDYITDITGINILVNTGAFEDRERPPRIRARLQASVEVALNHIVREGSRPGHPLAWKIEGSNVRIDNPERLKDYQLRIYDIRDLLVSVSDTIADTAGNGGGGGGDWWDDNGNGNGVSIEMQARVPGIRLERRARALEGLIKSVIEPGRWRRRETNGNDVDEPADSWWGQFGAANDRGEVGPYIHFRDENPGDFLIVQTPEVHEQIEELFRELRKAIHIQVHVETRFVEVTESFLQEVGVQWEKLDFTPDFQPGDSGPRLSADIGTGIPVFPDRTEDPLRGLKFDFGIFEGVEMEAFLKAVRTSEHSRVTHTPTITLMNTQRGQLWVRTSRYFITEYDVQDDHYTPEVEEYFDGIMLDIRPIVSSCRRYVYLELKPAINKIIAVDERTQMFTITEEREVGDDVEEVQRAVEVPVEHPRRLIQEFFNTVGVPDRGLLVVGGLGESEEREIETGIPLLSKLPIMKRLFGSEGRRREDKTLLILVRPRIIMFHEEEELAF